MEFSVPVIVWNIVNNYKHSKSENFWVLSIQYRPNEDKNQNYIISLAMKITKDANAEYEIIIYPLYMGDLTFW